MAEPLPPPATDTGKKLVGRMYVAGETPLTSGETVELLPPGTDEFSLSPEERKEYGIADHETHRWIRNSAFWKDKEMSDRGRAFVRGGEGRRIVRDKEGHVVELGDLMLAVVPKAEEERSARAQEQSLRDFQKQTEGKAPISNGHETIPSFNSNISREDAIAEWQANQQSGLIGPTGGWNLEDAIASFGIEKLHAEQARYRSGGRSFDVQTDAQERASNNNGNRAASKMISIPNNVRPKNIAGAKGR